MAQRIDQEQVRKVAKLSRLEVTDEEVEQFSSQLSSILEYIEKLNELDTDHIEPMAHCLPVHNIFREDATIPSLGGDMAVMNAPQTEDRYFKVPRILDDNSGA